MSGATPTVGDLVRVPRRFVDASPLGRQICPDGRGIVASIVDGWAMVAIGEFGQFGFPAAELRRVCPGEAFTPPSCGLDFLDFPTAWHIARAGVVHTDRRCSYVQTWGAVLCDCGAVEAEWRRRKGVVR